MRNIRFIGDIHGNFYQYLNLINSCDESVQIGDHGIGFVRRGKSVLDAYKYIDFQPYTPIEGHRFIRGNHDHPAICKLHPSYINDGHYEDGMMFVGGALSIDKDWRIAGESWWPDEELSYEELQYIAGQYGVRKPNIMVTHECPESVSDILVAQLLGGRKFNFPSRTREVFDVMLTSHRPKLWIFGHWHVSFDMIIDGTRFICLNELEAVDVKIDGDNIEVLKISAG